MTTERKRSIHDRNDGYYLKDIDSLHVIMPFIMPHRTNNEAVVGNIVDITNLDAYVQKKNADNPDFKYTWFHVICAALAKTLTLRPKMNYFITACRMYERKDIIIAFNVKRKFNDNSQEALAKLYIDRNGDAPIDQVYSYVKSFVTAVRDKDETKGITKKFNIYQHLPRFLLKAVVCIFKLLDFFGHYPKSLSKDDPCYSSVYVTNLGSIKMNADYHHIYEWGTNSFFAVIGEKKLRPFFNEDGTYTMKNTIKLSFTIDERIADGYYFAKSIKLLNHLLQNPELLDRPIDEAVEME